MKKRTGVILGIVIGVMFAYSVIATVGMIETRAELEQKTIDYEVTKKELLDLHEKYQKLVFDNATK